MSHEYTLTAKGAELCDLLLVMVRWGDRWTAGSSVTCSCTARTIRPGQPAEKDDRRQGVEVAQNRGHEEHPVLCGQITAGRAGEVVHEVEQRLDHEKGRQDGHPAAAPCDQQCREIRG